MRVSDVFAGRKGKCPACSVVIDVPTIAPARDTRLAKMTAKAPVAKPITDIPAPRPLQAPSDLPPEN